MTEEVMECSEQWVEENSPGRTRDKPDGLVSEQLEKGEEEDLPRRAPVELDELSCEKTTPGNLQSDIECLGGDRNDGSNEMNVSSQDRGPGGHDSEGERVRSGVIEGNRHRQRVVEGGEYEYNCKLGEMDGTTSGARCDSK
ncbi:hypothetical protein HD554DRAFT_2036991 [Boletus coccyginus]|nr:hypothetical protein HD554DRAFT_2036991 [Boletus coccyginus]